MEDFHQALGSLGLARARFRIFAQHVELNLRLNDLYQQTINGAPAGGNLLQHICALLLLLNGVPNALQLSLNPIHTNEKLFLLLDGKARLGDSVQKGQVLLRVQSADLSSAYSDYQKAVADEQLTRTQLERAQLLYDKGAISLNDLQVALTPTEVLAAWRAGGDFVKVFPCAQVGGDKYIKALKLSLPQIPLIAAGGVNQQTALDFMLAGATAIGVGTDLIPIEALERRQAERIRELAFRFAGYVKEARARMEPAKRTASKGQKFTGTENCDVP